MTTLLFTLFLGWQQADSTRTFMPPFPLTETEKTNATALAESLLVSNFLPIAPKLVKGIKVKGARLGEPFLDVTVRWRSINDYLDSAESDPRLYASLLLYCYPIWVNDRTAPVAALVVCRNRNEDGNKFEPNLGELFRWGYFGEDSRVQEAIQLQKRFGGQISFVQFLDTEIDGIIVDDSTGTRSSFFADSLVSMSEDARKIKRNLNPHRDY